VAGSLALVLQHPHPSEHQRVLIRHHRHAPGFDVDPNQVAVLASQADGHLAGTITVR